jgi:hypothetical protein
MQSIRSERFVVPRLMPLAACMAAALALTCAPDANADPILLHPMTALRLHAQAANSAPISQETLKSALARFHSSLHAAAPLKGHSRHIFARPASGPTLEVTDCNDGPPGSDSHDLRDTIAAATTGSTIDLTGLTACTNSVITLTNGAIPITVDDLNIQGPGASVLAIDGGYNHNRNYNRAFTHTGTGTLGIYDLTITDAIFKSTYAAYGGCIGSNGSVLLMDSAVTQCGVLGAGPIDAANPASGGGIFAEGGVIVKYSMVSGNGAFSYFQGSGGGAILTNGRVGGSSIFAKTSFVSKYSAISNNSANSLVAGFAQAGGIDSSGNGDVSITGTTISGNYAEGSYGALFVDSSDTYSTSITNSTISSNKAVDRVGGVAIAMPMSLTNSTIASNVTVEPSGLGAGLLTTTTAIFQSSLIGLNVDGTDDRDFSSTGGVITGDNNLITVATVDVPTGTLNDCAKLAPLADNGGLVLTQALLSGSKAMDAGNNSAGLTYDTRGTPFNRVVGANADIGSYERQPGVKDDILFQSRFESRCR